MTAQNLKSAALQYVAGTLTVSGFVGGVIVAMTLLLGAFANADDILEKDQVIASFERALNHDATPASAVTRSAIRDDVLYRALNAIHWSTPQEVAKAARSSTDSPPCRL